MVEQGVVDFTNRHKVGRYINKIALRPKKAVEMQRAGKVKVVVKTKEWKVQHSRIE